MFRHLLVPLDGSKLAESVLPATTWFAQRFDAQVKLLHVMEEAAPATVHSELHLSTVAEAEVYLKRLVDQLRAFGLKVSQHLHDAKEGDVVQSILVHAEEMEVDLIVLCAHGSGGWRDRLVGNIAQQVLAKGTRPVLLIRPGRAPAAVMFDPKQLIMPLDWSPAHEPALPAAKAIASVSGAAIHLITVVATPQTLSAERAPAGTLLPSTTHAILELTQQRATEYLRGLLKEFAEEKIRATAEVARGGIAQAICDATARVRADLLVLGTHGRTVLEAFWSGSATPKILEGVDCPVLLVRVTGAEAPR